jgi:hypothetical protein
MQYYDTGKDQVFLVLLLIAFIMFNIMRAKGGKKLFIRRIAGLSAIDEAVGRSTEMGRPVLMVPGLSGLGPVGIQAVNIFAYITRTAVKFSTPIRLCLAEAQLYSVAQEIIRDVYQSEGVPEKYDPDSVRFVSDRQFAFAAGVAGLIHRERVAAAFLMGDWFAESLILAESANAVGAIQVAASTVTTQTPFLIASCDYVLIGDEFYAASAYLSHEPVLVGSLVGQDWSKLTIAAMIVVLACYTSYQRSYEKQLSTAIPGDLGLEKRAINPMTVGGRLVYEDKDKSGKTVLKDLEIQKTSDPNKVIIVTTDNGQKISTEAVYRTRSNKETEAYRILMKPHVPDPLDPKREKKPKQPWDTAEEGDE